MMDAGRIPFSSLVIPIKCVAKNYDWGKLGSESIVASVIESQNLPVDENAPYAEVSHEDCLLALCLILMTKILCFQLWMGSPHWGPTVLENQ